MTPKVLPTVPGNKRTMKMPQVWLNGMDQEVMQVTAPAVRACEIPQIPISIPYSHQQVQKIVNMPQPLMRKPAGRSKERPFQCDDCGSQFSKKYDLNLHKMYHTGERPHKCDICGKGFRMRWRVILHRRTHTGEKPYACAVCGFRANRKDNMRGHIQRIHGYSLRGTNNQINMVSAPTPWYSYPQWKGGKRTVKQEPIIHSNMQDVPLQKDPIAFRQINHIQQQDHYTPKYSLHNSKNHCIPKRGRSRHRRKIYRRKRQTLKQNSMEIARKKVPMKIKHIFVTSGQAERRILPRREAGHLGNIRRLSLMLDEEDIKKEIDGFEPLKRKTYIESLIASSQKPTTSRIIEKEAVTEGPTALWMTQEDLLFTKGGRLKLEEIALTEDEPFDEYF